MSAMMSDFRIELSETDQLTLRGRHSFVAGRTLAPRVEGLVEQPLTFSRGSESPAQIGPIAGTIVAQEAILPGQRITREAFHAADGRMAALRMSVTNTGVQPIELQALIPLYAEGESSLRAADTGLADWRIVRNGRQKNDVPGNYRFGDNDIDFEHAQIDAAEFRAGSGIQASDLAKSKGTPTRVQADPYLWIKNRRNESLPGWFVGVLGQTEHLTQFHLQSSEDRKEFFSLAAVCEMDGVALQLSQTRTSHWIAFWEDASEESMRLRYVDLIAALMNVPKPKPAPSYFCSWYFYGTDFTQADLEENLAELKKRPIPFDIFLIDNGWMDDFGSYNANHRFPDGMKHAADLMRGGGYQPGIWTCPFVIMKDSPAHIKYPNLIARNAAGEPVLFPYEQTKEWVIDPTSPDAEAYFAELFGKLRDWGFTAHKFDFLRAITSNPRIRFHDRSMNRAQAYRHGMAMIRRLVGPDAYILACGGLFEASAGLVDGMRVGSDTKGRWGDPNAANAYHRMGYVVRIKQNVFRNHTNRLWHTDPDALQLRCRTEPFRDRPEFFHLCEGSFTEDEAFTLVAHQYLGGGIVCLCERMAELPDHRYALLRRAMPTVTPPAKIVDFGHLECPTTFWTQVTPRWQGMLPWATLTVCNWSDVPVEREINLAMIPFLADQPRLAVMELATQTFLGVRAGKESVRIVVPRHGTRVLRVAAWDGASPILLGTDDHLSGGAAEFESLKLSPDEVSGIVGSPWAFPIKLTVGVPDGDELHPRSFTLPAGQREFSFPIQSTDSRRPRTTRVGAQ